MTDPLLIVAILGLAFTLGWFARRVIHLLEDIRAEQRAATRLADAQVRAAILYQDVTVQTPSADDLVAALNPPRLGRQW